jgi:hypothetical protein
MSIMQAIADIVGPKGVFTGDDVTAPGEYRGIVGRYGPVP